MAGLDQVTKKLAEVEGRISLLRLDPDWCESTRHEL
jgi:hypothetical protein